MMRSIVVKDGQCLLDVAMEHCGDAGAAWAIADLNNLAITEDLTTGQTLLVSDTIEPLIVEVFEPMWLKPASAKMVDADLFAEGLEYWIIEDDFVIS